MSLAPFLIQHPGGTRTLNAYTVPGITYELELSARVNRGGNITLAGDRGYRPQPFTVTAEVEAGSLGAAYALAYGIISESEAASLVRTHWGDLSVDGLMGFSVTPERGASVRLTLEFAPLTHEVADLAPILWGDSSVTFADAGITFGTGYFAP